jgi:hypothetical protein
MNIKDEVLACGSFNVNDGTYMRFWEDTWASLRPFKELYPTLSNIIAFYPHATMESVMGSAPLNISFRRALVGQKLDEWRLSSDNSQH